MARLGSGENYTRRILMCENLFRFGKYNIGLKQEIKTFGKDFIHRNKIKCKDGTVGSLLFLSRLYSSQVNSAEVSEVCINFMN
jgi:hypothetical protein